MRVGEDRRVALQRALMGLRATVKFDEMLARHTTFVIGGPADVYVVVDDMIALQAVVGFCRECDVKLWVLGRGSNVLISDQGLRGVVLRLAGELAAVQCRAEEAWIRAGAGALLDSVADIAEENSLTGAEFLAGIPGTVGGALRTNAGAFGRSLADIVEEVSAVDRNGKRVELMRHQLRNEYRRPVVDVELIVTAVKLRLHPGVTKPVSELRQRRSQRHPKEPSAGSYFRNPSSEPAGRIIERCGMKGRQLGGARVSEQHANFIVNVGNASFSHVYELAEIVKANVEAQTGTELEEEVQILPGYDDWGADWR
ncbi:MAG: UDP-N-acetylmuramate dehydrogenase [candidate division WOR-3 bacterium]